MNMPSKYDGTCRTCGKPIAKGEYIEWSKENGTHHTRCMQLTLFPQRDHYAAHQLADTLNFLQTGEHYK